jgi:MFS family permease
MIALPTSTSIAADSAPTTMRGRYMGILGLSWSVGFGVGPVLGGLVNDNISPFATWWILGSSALVAAFGYLLLSRFAPVRQNA